MAHETFRQRCTPAALKADDARLRQKIVATLSSAGHVLSTDPAQTMDLGPLACGYGYRLVYTDQHDAESIRRIHIIWAGGNLITLILTSPFDRAKPTPPLWDPILASIHAEPDSPPPASRTAAPTTLILPGRVTLDIPSAWDPADQKKLDLPYRSQTPDGSIIQLATAPTQDWAVIYSALSFEKDSSAQIIIKTHHFPKSAARFQLDSTPEALAKLNAQRKEEAALFAKKNADLHIDLLPVKVIDRPGLRGVRTTQTITRPTGIEEVTVSWSLFMDDQETRIEVTYETQEADLGIVKAEILLHSLVPIDSAPAPRPAPPLPAYRAIHSLPGIRMEIPADWLLREGDQHRAVATLAPDTLLRPAAGDADQTICLTSQDESDYGSLLIKPRQISLPSSDFQALTAAEVDQLWQTIVQPYLALPAERRILDPTPGHIIQVGDKSGLEYSFYQNRSDGVRRFHRLIMLDTGGKTSVSLHFTYSQATADHWAPIFEHIRQSLRVDPAPQPKPEPEPPAKPKKKKAAK